MTGCGTRPSAWKISHTARDGSGVVEIAAGAEDPAGAGDDQGVDRSSAQLGEETGEHPPGLGGDRVPVREAAAPRRCCPSPIGTATVLPAQAAEITHYQRYRG